MKKIGMKFRKVGALPAKADLEKQCVPFFVPSFS